MSDRDNEDQICLIGDFLIDEARRAERESELNCTVLCQISRPGPKISVDAASTVGTPEKELGFQHHPWRMN